MLPTMRPAPPNCETNPISWKWLRGKGFGSRFEPPGKCGDPFLRQLGVYVGYAVLGGQPHFCREIGGGQDVAVVQLQTGAPAVVEQQVVFAF